MTKVHEISQQEVEEFLDEAPTDPIIQLAQAQLDTASSVIDQLTAQGQSLGYRVDTRHWTEKLMEELEINEEDVLEELVDVPAPPQELS